VSVREKDGAEVYPEGNKELHTEAGEYVLQVLLGNDTVRVMVD